MLDYLIRRTITMMFTLAATSVLIFIIIHLPPGDYLSTYIAELQSQGEMVDNEKIEFLRRQYGLDKSMPEQYFTWVTGLGEHTCDCAANEVIKHNLVSPFCCFWHIVKPEGIRLVNTKMRSGVPVINALCGHIVQAVTDHNRLAYALGEVSVRGRQQPVRIYTIDN